MPTLPIFDAGPVASVYSVMRFPRDLDKASAMSSWIIAGRLDGTTAAIIGSADLTATIANGSARFAPWFKEKDDNEYAGYAVGAIVNSLLALRNENPKTASWDNAIDTVEAVASLARAKEARASNKTHLPVSKSSLRHYLKEFAPVLHLWGAWRIRGACLRAIREVGYSHKDDFEMFLCESETILEQLRSWDAQKHDNSRSDYLKADFFQVEDGWRPPVRKPGWPMTGIVRVSMFDRSRSPELPPVKGPGRPRKPSSKFPG
jgi:hypothetical protein